MRIAPATMRAAPKTFHTVSDSPRKSAASTTTKTTESRSRPLTALAWPIFSAAKYASQDPAPASPARPMKIQPFRSMLPSSLTSPAAIAATDVTAAMTIARAIVTGIGEISPRPILPKIATSAAAKAERRPRTTQPAISGTDDVLQRAGLFARFFCRPDLGKRVEPEGRENAASHIDQDVVRDA